MSKALVIKGANFLANRIEQITVSDPIPCTGISLSQNSLAFTQIGATATLTATLVPADTTEALTWVSSNEDVATVANGIVTCTGVGSATITATCGTFNVTCDVASTLTVVADDVWIAEDGYKYGGSVNLPTKDYISRSSDAASRLFYSETDELGGYRAFSGTTNAGKYAIPFPKGTTKIVFTKPDGATKYHFGFATCNTLERQTYVTGSDGDSARAVNGVIMFNQTSNEVIRDVAPNIADGANGFIFSYTFVVPTDLANITGKVHVRFE